MRMLRPTVTLPLLVLLGSHSAGAEEAPALTVKLGDAAILVPTAQYRPRFLAHGGRDFKPGGTYDAFSHRARLGVEARLLQWFGLMVQVQDVRLWGEELDTVGDYSAEGVDVHQAWAEVRSPWGLSLRVGRQELAYDNHRLIGTVDWSDQGRSFDAVRLAYASPAGRAQAHVFYAKTGEKDAYLTTKDAEGQEIALRGSSEDTDLVGLWARFARSPHLGASLLALYDWNGANDQHRVTAGVYVDGAPWGGLRYSAELYYQLGERGPSDARQDISALMAALGLGYRAPVRTHPSLSVWFEYLSGDDDPDDDTVTTFDTLYATNHKFYGLMDYFLNMPLHTAGLGLIDVGGRAKLEPHERLSFFLDYHHFELARPHSSGSRTLGNEVDLQVDLQINRFLAVQGVLGVFAPKLAMTRLRGTPPEKETEVYGYVQTDLKF